MPDSIRNSHATAQGAFGAQYARRRARLFALYLPQFHPIPENDEWWGKGFTEWTNTARATPMFRGHYQPHVPADLGFYDLRVPETREAQVRLADAYGIEGFCYYHYWFAGRRVLERPFNEVLASGQPDFPFCLCWANETWSGVWHGEPRRILIEQTYPGEADHRRHFEAVLPAFIDPRYARVAGAPVFFVYKPRAIPEAKRFTDLWRELAARNGFPGIHFVGLVGDADWDPATLGFDAFSYMNMPERRPWVSKTKPLQWLRRKWETSRGLPTRYGYEEVLSMLLPPRVEDRLHYPQVIHAWDNSPRSRGNGLVLQGSRPELFRQVLRAAIEAVQRHDPENRIVLLKSWNEWAEGNHLEPDLRDGHAYLEAIRAELFR